MAIGFNSSDVQLVSLDDSGDLTLDADIGNSGVGDIVFRTGGVEVAAFLNDGDKLTLGDERDVSLYRADVSTLKTDSKLQAVGDVAFAWDGTKYLLQTSGNKVVIGGDTNLYRSAAGILKTDSQLVVAGADAFDQAIVVNNGHYSLIRSANTSFAFSSVVTGDAVSRFVLRADGTMFFGDGANPMDLTVQRLQSGILRIGNTTQKGWLRCYGSNAGDHALEALVTTDPLLRFFVRSDGQLWWGDGASAVDTNLYRVAADILGSNSRLRITKTLTNDLAFETYVSGDTGRRFSVSSAGLIQWGPGDTTIDLTLYRSAAGLLRTDNNLQVVGYLQVGGHLRSAEVVAAATNGVKANKKLPIYDSSGVLQGYVELYAA